MISTVAIIESGFVIETMLIDLDANPDFFEAGVIWVDITSIAPKPGVGWAYDGTSFTPPTPPTPDSIYTPNCILIEKTSDDGRFAVEHQLSITQACIVGINGSLLPEVMIPVDVVNDASPLESLGDILYGDSDGDMAKLAGNASSTKKFLSQTGDGTNSTAPAWSQVGWSELTSKPTTIAGYGITDAVSLASPTFTGTVTVPTPTAGDNSTKAASTAYVNAVAAKGQFLGTSTNDNAASGNMGEYVSSTVLVGSAVSLTTATAANVTSISLAAGDWDVWGTVAFNTAAGTTPTSFGGWISTTSATFPTVPNGGAVFYTEATFPVGKVYDSPTGMMRLSIASTTTVYLSAYCTFGGSTQTSYGFIGARRAR